MSATAAPVRGLARAVSRLLIEPVDEAPVWSPQPPPTVRPVVAVCGLSARAGVTTVARALGVELALRDPGGAAVVTTGALRRGTLPLGTVAAGRLARAVARSISAPTSAVGRMCLAEAPVHESAALTRRIRHVAPVVIDVVDPALAATAAAAADAVALVALPDAEPALAAVVAESLTRIGRDPVVVVNRDLGDSPAWEGRAMVRLPESRMGARLAHAGREPRGALGQAVAELVDEVLRRAR